MKTSLSIFTLFLLLSTFCVPQAVLAQRITRMPVIMEEPHPVSLPMRTVPSIPSGSDHVTTTLGVPVPYATIGAALVAAANGDTIDIAMGVYAENIIVNKSVTIRGSGPASTIIHPSFTDPGFPTPGTFPAGHSTVFIIQANDVTLQALTIDGDNPSLTGGISVGGANIDARNAVVTDHTVGTFNNLTIRGVQIVNIFWRALYASSGGTFHFADNVIRNVQGSTSGSMAVFNWQGAGIVERDTISDCLGAIVANHSRGMNILNNVVVNSSDGIHSDNAGDGGGQPDTIRGNSVSNSPASGYGIWVFVPYLAPFVADNIVSNVDYGLGAFGGAFGTTVTEKFVHNMVDGQGRPGSIGFYVTNTTFSYGVTDVAVSLSQSEFRNNDYGLYVESAEGKTVTMSATGNAITANSIVGLDSGAVPPVYGNPSGLPGTLSIALAGNWWGSASGPFNAGSNATGTGNAIDDGLDYSPWWGGDFRTLPHPWAWYMNSSNGSTIQEAVDAVAATDIVNVPAGTYTEQIEIASSIVLTGAGSANTRIVSPPTLTKFFLTSGTTHNFPVVYVHDADAVVSGFTIDGAGRGNANYRFVGVGFRNAGGTLSHCTLRDVRDTPIGGAQHGVAVYAYADNGIARSLVVSADSVYDFQKTGMVLAGANLTANVNGNCVTGAGPISFTAQNGIQMSSGATGTISENRVEGIAYTPFTYVATGVLLYAAGGDVAVARNTITESMVGIYFINCQGNADSNVISNTLAGMGSTPYWWGVIVDPGEGVRRQPPVAAMDVPDGGRPGRLLNPLLLTTGVHANTLHGGGNGSGIEVDVYGTETLNCTATGNILTGWTAGIVLYKDAGATLGGSAHENSLAGNAWGLVNQAGVLFDAKQNWWGHATGPRDVKSLPGIPNYNNPGGLGDSVSEYAEYRPWYLDEARTTLLFTTAIAPDWNMISNPVSAANDSATVLFPTLLNGYVYSYSMIPGYLQCDVMTNGSGYWGKFPADAVVTFTGDLRARDSIDIVEGWNMIGSISLPVDTGSIVCMPAGLIASNWIGYDGGYTPATQILPGSGYWVKANGPGKIVMAGGPAMMKSPMTVNNPLAALNVLRITDNRGRSQELYFGADPDNAISASRYDMPPIPPAGAFDARFEKRGGGSMIGLCVERGESAVDLPVTIQTDAYPLIIQWTIKEAGASYELAGGGSDGSKLSCAMTGNGSLRIDNGDMNRILVRKVGSDRVPGSFALAQNYPNPFNPGTTIAYSLPVNAHVTLRVFNLIGQEVATLVNDDQKAGYRSVEWNPSSIASGVYYYRIDAGSFSQVRKLLLLK